MTQIVLCRRLTLGRLVAAQLLGDDHALLLARLLIVWLDNDFGLVVQAQEPLDYLLEYQPWGCRQGMLQE